MIILKMDTRNEKLSIDLAAEFEGHDSMIYEGIVGIHAILQSLDDALKKQKEVVTSELIRLNIAEIISDIVNDFKNEKLERIENVGE